MVKIDFRSIGLMTYAINKANNKIILKFKLTWLTHFEFNELIKIIKQIQQYEYMIYKYPFYLYDI